MKRDDIVQLLPEVFRTTLAPHTPMAALLETMEAMHGPAEQALEDVDVIFDPYRAPDAFVPALASWLDLDRFFPPRANSGGVWDANVEPLSSGIGRLRELIAAATSLSQWRGTSAGLTRFLEVATGIRGYEIDEQVNGEDGVVRPFHLEVRAPAEAKRYQALVERILQQEKPAYVTYQLVFKQ